MSTKSQQPIQNVSSPNSTGGGGTHFEQHVDAAFLAWLLVGAIPPIFTTCQIKEVHLQTERLGWKTDDIVVESETSTGQIRRLVCQVKQSLTISDKDDEFRKSLTDAWNDFKNGSLFDKTEDRIAFVALRGTDVLLRHFATLLDNARHSRTEQEFSDRLKAKGLLHNTVKRHYTIIETILNEVEDTNPSVESIWHFLTVLHVISFDLNTITKQTESQILSLLAHTVGGANSLELARATWNDLLAEVGVGKPNAKSYRREHLSSELQSRHGIIENKDHETLQRLREHTDLIFEGVRTTIGTSEQNIQLPRNNAILKALELLEDSKLLLLTGSAGAGKSCVAKQIAQVLESDSLCFAFRAEEFAVSHFDQTLLNAQCNSNGVALSATLSSQSKKTVFVESVERLLEASTREAFSDLLTLAKRDPTWQIVLTCRDYSADVVRSSLLQLSGLTNTVFQVPKLSDAELGEIAEACPQIRQAFVNKRLKELLRNPYMLDKATQMSWSPDVAVPENEKEFRDKFWGDIIRANDKTANGMPRQRHQAFMEVAVRRAKALSMYVTREGVADEPVNALLQDSLVLHSEKTDGLIAPAHDVLEDWAILKWIDEQFALSNNNVAKLCDAMGTYPAIRRSYRKWLEELSDTDTNASEPLFTQALTNNELPSHFRDDTIVSLLRSENPDELIGQQSELLFRQDKHLLKRVIHLLRVGCLSAQDWCTGLDYEHDIPEGKAWSCVLRLISNRLDLFDETNSGLLLGLIRDASKSASWRNPYPDGANEMVAIAHWLLQFFDNYKSEEQCKKTLEIIAKFPNCNEDKFRELMADGGRKSDRKNRFARELRDMVLSGIEGDAACRDVPDAVIAAHHDSVILKESDLEDRRRGFSHSDGTEPCFGIQPHTHFNRFPPSAFQGPFYFLLRHNYAVGESHLITLMNHSVKWIAEKKVENRNLERPRTIGLTFENGETVEQLGNERMWCFYRSTTVGPYLLQSALMALEKRLLDIAKLLPEDLDLLLIRLMKSTTNAAVTAVAASVATAHPHKCSETIKVLLSSSDCIFLDKYRLAHESQSPSRLAEMIPSLGGHELHEQERRSADALPHRSTDLENAVMNLQLGAHSADVQKIIDAHLAEMPSAEERTKEDMTWLLTLRRMDIRQYKMSDEQPEPAKDQEEEAKSKIRLDLKVDESDVRAMSEEATAHHERMEHLIGLEMWGMKVFENEINSNYDPKDWKSKLSAAQQPQCEQSRDEFGRNGPVWIASVCIRDHLNELGSAELNWCIDAVCNAIELTAEHWNVVDRAQQFSLSADRPAAWIISNLLERECAREKQEQIRRAMVFALTHPIDEVKGKAVEGVAENVWERLPELGKQCLNSHSLYAVEVQKRWNEEQEKSYKERKDLNEIENDVAHEMRDRWFAKTDSNHYLALNIGDWIGSEANILALLLLRRSPHENQTVAAFAHLATTLVQWWDEDDENRGRERTRRSQKARVNLPMLLEDYVLRIDEKEIQPVIKPILDATDRHPKEVASILQGIVGAEDRNPSLTNFWPVWRLFADRIKKATWLPLLDSEYSEGSELLATIFLTRYWKRNIRHWKGLSEGAEGGHAHNVHQLFNELPATSILLDSYCSFLFQIGETSLPLAFEKIANKLKLGQARVLLSRSNTVFHLEALLRRHVYSRPVDLKNNESMRVAVMYLLDQLIEVGSSSAYRMRDDFVTPLPIQRS